MFRNLCIVAFLLTGAFACEAQTDSTGYNPNWDYQIYLKKPAREIKELLYDNTCEPVNGKLSGDRKEIIMKGYKERSRIYIRVIYEDGTEDEFIRSSCFIDPVI